MTQKEQDFFYYIPFLLSKHNIINEKFNQKNFTLEWGKHTILTFPLQDKIDLNIFEHHMTLLERLPEQGAKVCEK